MKRPTDIDIEIDELKSKINAAMQPVFAEALAAEQEATRLADELQALARVCAQAFSDTFNDTAKRFNELEPTDHFPSR